MHDIAAIMRRLIYIIQISCVVFLHEAQLAPACMYIYVAYN